MAKRIDDNFSEEEAARRRDEVVRRMANTAPQHKSFKVPNRRPKKRKKAAAGRAIRKGHARREA